MEPLVSIIVPVYKTEKYLDACISSIVNQTYNNLEIILIDDGSPDKCPQICDEWAEQDDRIFVIHQANAGQSAARNAGLDIARGEYVLFVDSDDYVSKSHVLDLYNLIEKYHVDIAMCELMCVNEQGKQISRVFNDGNIELLDTVKALSYLLDGRLVTHGPIVKLCSKKLFSEIRFPEGKTYEDVGTTYRLLLQCSPIAVLRKVSYYYLHRNNSTIRSKFSEKQMDAMWMKEKMREDILEYYPELKEKANRDLFGTCVSLFGKMDKEENKDCYLAIEKKITALRKKIVFGESVRFKYRVFAAISYMGTDVLHFFIRHIFHPLIKMIKKAEA